MKLSRRKFVAQSSGLMFALSPFLEFFPDQNIFASSSQKTLVLIHLAGGNDWFNTVIPYQSPEYYQFRPDLAILPNKVLPLNGSLAFHPSMAGIKKLYDRDNVAILLNIGHDQPTLSHHKAIEIWQNAWLDRYAKLVNKAGSSSLVFPAINVEPSFPPKDQMIVSTLSPDNKFDVDIHYRLPRRGGLCPARSDRPADNNFANGLQLIADMIKQNCNAPVYNISLGGFDTHSDQLQDHQLLLHMLSEGILSFQQNIEKQGLTDQVLTVVYSEFGRSLEENSDLGTDHGLTNHALIIGNGIKGGIYGRSDRNHCDLDDWLWVTPGFNYERSDT